MIFPRTALTAAACVYVANFFHLRVSVYIRLATSIRCLECNSYNNSMCLDPKLYDQETLDKFLPSTSCGDGVLTANHHGFFCRKIVQTILKKGYEPDIRVTRSCGWVRHRRDCYKADNEDHLETVCQCFSDDCNSADTLNGLNLLLAAICVLFTY